LYQGRRGEQRVKDTWLLNLALAGKVHKMIAEEFLTTFIVLSDG
jgi:hypothetical protein